jgi:hypothetical protein
MSDTCAPMKFWIGGHGPVALDGGKVIRWLERVLGLRLA